MFQEKMPNGLLRIDTEFIMKHLKDTRVCEVCDLPLEEHDWAELGKQGFVERCSNVNPDKLPKAQAPEEDEWKLWFPHGIR